MTVGWFCIADGLVHDTDRTVHMIQNAMIEELSPKRESFFIPHPHAAVSILRGGCSPIPVWGLRARGKGIRCYDRPDRQNTGRRRASKNALQFPLPPHWRNFDRGSPVRARRSERIPNREGRRKRRNGSLRFDPSVFPIDPACFAGLGPPNKRPVSVGGWNNSA